MVWFGVNGLFDGSIVATLLASAPSLVVLFRNPTERQLLYALSIVSLSFFLFSFQVHEKTILVPLLPISLLAGTELELFFWIVDVASFSMFPLLKKDGLAMVYWILLGGWNYFLRPRRRWTGSVAQIVVAASYAGMGIVHLADAFLIPPARFPDLFVVGNVLLSCAVFVGVWGYLNWRGCGG